MIPYKFKTLNHEEYDLTLELSTGARIIKKLFEKTKKKLIKRSGKDITDADYTVLKEFSVPQDVENIFFPVINRVTIKTQKEIFKEVMKDGILVLDCGVKGVVYRLLENGGWRIIITLGGRYLRK